MIERRARPLDAHLEEDVAVRVVDGRAARSPSSRRRRRRPATRKLASNMTPGDRQQPERERVQARERHVRRAEHQRHDEVREAGERRDDEEEDHQRGVHRDRPLKVCGSTNCIPGCASSARKSIAISPPMTKKMNVVDDVLDADHLVVGVDAEVVLPADSAPWPEWSSGRVGRPRDVVEPVVEGADAGEEAERRRDQARRPG